MEDWKTKGMLMHHEGFLPAIFCDEKLIPMMAQVIGADEDEIAFESEQDIDSLHQYQ